MSEFEKELENKVSPHDRTRNGNELFLGGVLAVHFKDWQPPKPQQALPVVPEDVDKAIKYLKKHNNSTLSDLGDILTEKGFGWLNDFQFKDRRFGFGGLNNKLFILSHLAITGYTVEKEQLFYLRAKELLVVGDYDHVEDLWLDCNKNFTPKKQDAHKFTQEEIDSMQTGNYEQIEVEP